MRSRRRYWWTYGRTFDQSSPGITCYIVQTVSFNCAIRARTTDFGYSYIVPIPKSNVGFSKPLNYEDFRGIAISPINSKVFEYCFVNKLDFLSSKANQFGFKKDLGCNHAICTVHKIVEMFTSGGNTVNLCSIDLSKAFDKVNHRLLIKLMKRNLPLCFLEIEHWLNICHSVVK